MADLQVFSKYLKTGYGRVGYTVGMNITDVTFQRGLASGHVFPGTYNGKRFLSDCGELGTIESVLGTFRILRNGRYYQHCTGWYAVNISVVPSQAAVMALAARKAPAQIDIN
jgi:hypothetical protein